MLRELQKNLISLVNSCESEWKQVDYKPELLPRIASEMLKSITLTEPPDVESILNELVDIDLPQQNFPNGEFSDFALTIARTERLLADIYFWYKSDTSIHNHHFCGAFKVLKGDSYQLSYSFDVKRKISAGFTEGEMREVGNEHLKKNSVTMIHGRDEFIHHVFHLGKPTITLCLRNNFVEGEALSSYIYPKYRLTLTPLKSFQAKWLQGLNVQLEINSNYRTTIPWEEGETVRILFLSSTKQISLSPFVASYLLKEIEDNKNYSDFFNCLKNQQKFNEKLKKFGTVSRREKN